MPTTMFDADRIIRGKAKKTKETSGSAYSLVEENKRLEKCLHDMEQRAAKAAREATMLQSQLADVSKVSYDVDTEHEAQTRSDMKATFENIVAILQSDEDMVYTAQSTAMCIRTLYHWINGHTDGPLHLPAPLGSASRRLWPEGSKVRARNIDPLVSVLESDALSELNRVEMANVVGSIISPENPRASLTL